LARGVAVAVRLNCDNARGARVRPGAMADFMSVAVWGGFGVARIAIAQRAFAIQVGAEVPVVPRAPDGGARLSFRVTGDAIKNSGSRPWEILILSVRRCRKIAPGYPTMTDWTYRPGRGEAEVSFHEADEMSEGRPVAVVSWDGDEHLVPHIPGAYFDKIFCGLGADDLLERVTRFVDGMGRTRLYSLLAGFADSERLTISGRGGIRLPAARVRDGVVAGKRYAGVKATIVATDLSLGATTHFAPRLRGQNRTVAEFGFWALWDWMILLLLRAEDFDALERSFDTFGFQLNRYRASGIPSFSEIGVAPLLAAMQRRG
jgi:hypothetical protein